MNRELEQKKFFENSLTRFDITKEPKPVNDTLRGLPVGETGMIIAPGSTGKSMFILNLMLSICGMSRNHLIYRPLKVLLVSLEDRLDDIQRRLYNYSVALNISEQNVLNCLNDFKIIENKSADRLIDKNIPQNQNPLWLALNAKIKEGDFDLVVVDTLIKSFSGDYDENSNTHMAMVLSHFNSLAIENNCSVLLTHHTNKGAIGQNAEINQANSRGASSLVDNSRYVLSLSTNEDKTGVICQSVKTNFSAPISQEYRRDYKGTLIMEDLDHAA